MQRVHEGAPSQCSLISTDISTFKIDSVSLLTIDVVVYVCSGYAFMNILTDFLLAVDVVPLQTHIITWSQLEQ